MQYRLKKGIENAQTKKGTKRRKESGAENFTACKNGKGVERGKDEEVKVPWEKKDLTGEKTRATNRGCFAR